MVLQIYKTGDLKYITPFGNCEGANIVVKDTLNGRMAYTYASEAVILNMALFGRTAAQWRSEKGISGKIPNIRDFASAEELVVLINLEDTNADLIRQEVSQIDKY